MTMVRTLTALTFVAVTGCASTAPGVPVMGAAEDVDVLVGEWTGTYAFDHGDWRSGSIMFTLETARDTARGDVVMMIPPTHDIAAATPVDQRWVQVEPAGRVLSIQFVRASRGTVSGVLDPYVDPSCGCSLETRFQGRVGDGAIEGTFTARRLDTGEARNGRWRVTRRD